MPSVREVSIDEVVDLLGLETDPRGSRNGQSYNVRCPFCGGSKYKMNINSAKNVYRCVRCSGNDTHTGVLDLYGRVRFGEKFVPGPSGNGKELAAALYREIDGQKIELSSDLPAIRKRCYSPALPADDRALNEVYSALMSLDCMKLSGNHRTALHNRGLDDPDIDRNGYATMPPAIEWISRHPNYLYNENYARESGLLDEALKYPRLRYVMNTDVVAGLLIAEDLLKEGVELEGVPGFYMIGERWLFNAEPGLLIPTRNTRGEIVGLQVRRDGDSTYLPRYMTVSSKGLEKGPDTNISRVHFPLGNVQPDGKKIPVILTEGPLKADVASHLFPTGSCFIALQGVNNYREIPGIAEELRRCGVNEVYSALDMDKLVNPFVAKAGRDIRRIFAEKSIRLIPMLWDSTGAAEYELMLKGLCTECEAGWKESGNVFRNIAENVASLIPSKMDYDSFRGRYPWYGKKGIDDYLLENRKGLQQQ